MDMKPRNTFIASVTFAEPIKGEPAFRDDSDVLIDDSLEPQPVMQRKIRLSYRRPHKRSDIVQGGCDE